MVGLESIETPAFILDQDKMNHNIHRMQTSLRRFDVTFRPHVKTSKCIQIAHQMLDKKVGAITVSTLREADYFAEQGIKDILYAVAITPNKLDHVAMLRAKSVKLSIVLDSVETAKIIIEWAKLKKETLDVLIEIDSDGHRSGVKPQSEELIQIALLLKSAGIHVMGVMTHAGESYNCRSIKAIQVMAEQERLAVVTAAERLRGVGIACSVVSMGSTPTALYAECLDGVTEVRAGVFVFLDLVMVGLEVCALEDIAVSVLTSVIGHQVDKGWIIVDAGWMALSRDRGTAKQKLDQGYGVVCDANGKPLPDFIVVDANQEHGIIAHRSGNPTKKLDLPVGSLLLILPNHACATAAQHGGYHVLSENNTVTEYWQRFSGW